MLRHLSPVFGLAFLLVGCTTSTSSESTTSLPVATTESPAPNAPATTEVSDDARAFLTEFLTTQLSEAAVSVSSIDCFVDEVIDSGMAEELDALGPEDAEARAAFLADFADLALGSDCLTDEELDSLSLASSVPSSFGDNAELDRLWTACSEAEFTACDLLLMVAGNETDYQDFGYTCGGLSSSLEWCAVQHGTEPDFELLRTECGEGEFGSCDLLWFYLFPEDEDFEFGATCGGRVEAIEIPCFHQFGQGFRP